jgi:hypothetical protein
MFSDLECDYINPIDLCNKLNQVCISPFTPRHAPPLAAIFFLSTSLILDPQFVLPENLTHAFLTTLFLLSGQWTAFLLNVPLLAFNANKYVWLFLVSRTVSDRHIIEYETKTTCMTQQKSFGHFPDTRKRASLSLDSTYSHSSIISIGQYLFISWLQKPGSLVTQDDSCIDCRKRVTSQYVSCPSSPAASFLEHTNALLLLTNSRTISHISFHDQKSGGVWVFCFGLCVGEIRRCLSISRPGW